MFIYIFDDGMIYQSKTPPTEQDLLSIDEGILQVIRIKDGIADDVGFDGVYCPLPKAIISEVGGDFCHIPEEDFEANEEEEG